MDTPRAASRNGEFTLPPCSTRLIAILLIALGGSSLLSPGASVASTLSSDPVQQVMICISNERGGSVSLINPVDLSTSDAIPVGKRPRGIHASPDGRFLYVAVSGTPIGGPPVLDDSGRPIEREIDPSLVDEAAHGIVVLDLENREVVRRLSAGSDPEEFGLTPGGTRLFVSNEDVGTVTALDPSTGEVLGIMRVTEEPEGVTVSPDGKHVWVTCETDGDIFVFDTDSFEEVAKLRLGGRPRTVTFDRNGGVAWIPSETTGELHEVDAKRREVRRTVKLPAGARPMDVAVSPSGDTLYVSTGRYGKVCVLDAGSLELRKEIAVGPRPWGLVVSPDGSRVFVANGPSNDVSVLDAVEGREIAKIRVGESPWGAAVVVRQGGSRTSPSR